MANTKHKDNESNEEFLARQLKELEEEFKRLNAIEVAEEQLDDQLTKDEKVLPEPKPSSPPSTPGSPPRKKKKKKKREKG